MYTCGYWCIPIYTSVYLYILALPVYTACTYLDNSAYVLIGIIMYKISGNHSPPLMKIFFNKLIVVNCICIGLNNTFNVSQGNNCTFNVSQA